ASGVAWTFDLPGANYPVVVLGTTTNAAGHCDGTFEATRTWAVTDPCGNSAQCSQNVSVLDTTGPVINCGNAKTVEIGTAWTFDSPTASDLGGTNITIAIVSTVTNTSGHCGKTFDATRTWQATDPCGNFSRCSQTVTVVDTTAPVITCSANKTVELGTAWSFDAPSASDIGGTNIAITIVSTVTNSARHCGNTFDATQLCQTTDACGTRSRCSQTLSVAHTTAPAITCSNTNKTVEFGASWA